MLKVALNQNYNLMLMMKFHSYNFLFMFISCLISLWVQVGRACILLGTFETLCICCVNQILSIMLKGLNYM